MSDSYRPAALYSDRRHDHERDRYEPRHDYYDQGYRRDDYERYTSSRRPDSYGSEMYSFRGAAGRTEHRPQEEFTFRASAPSGPRFPPTEPRDARLRRDDRAPRDRPYQDRQAGRRAPTARRGDRGGFRRGGRGGFVPRPAHNRDLLQSTRRSVTPEQLSGMNMNGHARFIALDSEDEGSESGEVVDFTQDTDDDDEPRKRPKTSETTTEAVEVSVPKWSNPDVYTSLPPPEASGGPKKDIVKFIRKAKVDSTSKGNGTNAVSDNVDFISFNFDDEDEEASSERQVANSESDYAPPSDPHDIPNGTNGRRSPLHDLSQRNSNRFSPGHSSISGRSERPSGTEPIGPPPPPPRDLVMPTDEELLAAYADEGRSRKRKRGDQSSGVGGIVKAWEANHTDPTPWYQADEHPTFSPALRLHKEVCDFYEYVRPHDYEDVLRRDLINRVQQAVRSFSSNSRNVEIKSFGSFAAGIYLPTADMDLVALSPSFLRSGYREFCQSKTKLFQLSRHLDNCGLVTPGTLSVIPNAKVPIIKFADSLTGIKVDISVENITGLEAVETFEEWKDQFPAMPALVVLIKQMLAMRGLNEVHTGGIGGFTSVCLVVSMMQLMPELQSGDMDASTHFGNLLLNFLDLYGNKFHMEGTGITMDPPGYYDKINAPRAKQNNSRLTIIDPNNPNNDISGGSRNVDAVFKVFRSAHAAIQRRLYRISTGEEVIGSILDCVWGGNYSSFTEQRKRLQQLSSGRAFRPPPSHRYSQPASPPQHAPPIQQPLPPRPPPPASIAPVVERKQPKREKKAPAPKEPIADPLPALSRRKRKKEDESLVARANDFKRTHPNVAGVPDRLTRNEFAVLKKKHG